MILDVADLVEVGDQGFTLIDLELVIKGRDLVRIANLDAELIQLEDGLLPGCLAEPIVLGQPLFVDLHHPLDHLVNVGLSLRAKVLLAVVVPGHLAEDVAGQVVGKLTLTDRLLAAGQGPAVTAVDLPHFVIQIAGVVADDVDHRPVLEQVEVVLQDTIEGLEVSGFHHDYLLRCRAHQTLDHAGQVQLVG